MPSAPPAEMSGWPWFATSAHAPTYPSPVTASAPNAAHAARRVRLVPTTAAIPAAIRFGSPDEPHPRRARPGGRAPRRARAAPSARARPPPRSSALQVVDHAVTASTARTKRAEVAPLRRQLAPALCREAVSAPPSPVHRRGVARQEAARLEAVQRRIDRPLGQVEGAGARVTDRLDDRVAVQRLPSYRAEEEQVEVASRCIGSHSMEAIR